MNTGMRQIVIEIDETKYNTIMNYPKEWDEWALNAIKHGVSLPKGHGRIADIDKLIDEKCNECGHIRGVSCTIPCYEVRRISSIPIIIEADKEVKNVKNADSN